MDHKRRGMGAKGAIDGSPSAEREPGDESSRENTDASESMWANAFLYIQTPILRNSSQKSQDQ